MYCYLRLKCYFTWSITGFTNKLSLLYVPANFSRSHLQVTIKKRRKFLINYFFTLIAVCRRYICSLYYVFGNILNFKRPECFLVTQQRCRVLRLSHIIKIQNLFITHSRFCGNQDIGPKQTPVPHVHREEGISFRQGWFKKKLCS